MMIRTRLTRSPSRQLVALRIAGFQLATPRGVGFRPAAFLVLAILLPSAAHAQTPLPDGWQQLPADQFAAAADAFFASSGESPSSDQARELAAMMGLPASALKEGKVNAAYHAQMTLTLGKDFTAPGQPLSAPTKAPSSVQQVQASKSVCAK